MEVIHASVARLAGPAPERQLDAACSTRTLGLRHRLHCPLTPETHHLIDAEALAPMRATAILINTARGPIVDQDALRVGAGERRRSPARRSTSPTPSRCRPTTRC